MKTRLLICAGAASAILCGCSSLDFDFFKKKEPVETKKERSPYSILIDKGNGVQVVDSGTVESDVIPTPELKSEPQVWTNEEAEPLPPTVAGRSERKDMDALYKKLFSNQGESESEYIKVAINFDAANLGDVIPAFATPLKMNYLLDPGVSGTITMSVRANLRPREVWTLFEQILQLAGAYCEMENQVVHIRPVAKIPQEKKIFQPDSNIEVRLRPLKHVTAKDVAAQLRNFLSDAATVTSLDQQNAVLLVENSANMERLLLLVDQLDRKARDGWQKAVFVCRNVSAAQLAQELMDILPVLGFPVADGKPDGSSGEISISKIDRIQAVVVSTATREALAEVHKWVKALDRSDVGEQERVYLYEVVNGKADELLNALSIVFPVDSSTMTAGVSGGGTSGGGASSSATGNSRPAATAATGRTGGATASAAVSSGSKKEEISYNIFDTRVKVFADAVHNRLLIRATPRAYAMIRAILDRMDTIPSQILMQVLVVEIELSDSNEFGMEFSFASTGDGAKSIFGTNFEALSPNTGGGQGQTGGTFAIFNPKNPDEKFGYIRALASKNRMKVLFSPQIVVKSNAKARLSVGKRVPVISNEITDTQSSVDPNNTSLRRSYQYEETGIILNVTPQITKGGMISMEIEQTISDAVENTMRGIDSPIIKEDILETTLAIRDGRTLIMGGLIREKQNEVISSLPGIIDIPFLRTLFSNTVKSAERTEILVLVTATIIREQSDLEAMIRRYNQAIREIEQFEYRQYKEGRQLDERAAIKESDVNAETVWSE